VFIHKLIGPTIANKKINPVSISHRELLVYNTIPMLSIWEKVDKLVSTDNELNIIYKSSAIVFCSATKTVKLLPKLNKL